MKFAITVGIMLWLLCGLIGAWMLDDLDPQYWKVIAKGPITLIRAINTSDTQYPWE